MWEGFEEGSKSKVKNAVCVCVYRVKHNVKLGFLGVRECVSYDLVRTENCCICGGEDIARIEVHHVKNDDVLNVWSTPDFSMNFRGIRWLIPFARSNYRAGVTEYSISGVKCLYCHIYILFFH